MEPHGQISGFLRPGQSGRVAAKVATKGAAALTEASAQASRAALGELCWSRFRQIGEARSNEIPPFESLAQHTLKMVLNGIEWIRR